VNKGRERLEIIYSIVVLIAIPILFVVNTVLITSRVQNDSDRNVRRTADQINSVIAESLRSTIESKKYDQTDKVIDSIKQKQPNISGIFVATRGDNGYDISARASDAPTSLSQNDRLQLSIVFDRSRAAAKRIDTKSTEGELVKGWNVITPLTDKDNKTIAAISTNVLTSDTEELIDNTLMISFIVSGVSVIVIVGLLLHHMRYVRYADLLRRQKEVNQMMSDFLSVATHELKAPMSIIKGYISMVTDGTFGEVNDKIKEQLNVASNQTDRLNNLVQDLLNVSRIEQGRLTIEPKNVDISAIIKTLITNYSHKAGEKNLQLVYDAPQPVWVYADQSRVQEIMTNLIDNAIKYTPKGQVTIKHRNEGKKVITSVVDTGPGMSAEESSRLFQRFYRVRNDNTKDIPGTGLGLWIIKQYAEKMGGTITVSSIVGVGTDFTVVLPVGSADAPAPEPASKESASPAPSSTKV
jgi:signal transduction histidine kinase